MGETLYSSNFAADRQDYYFSKYKSNLNFFGGYPPYEDSSSSEDSSSEASSCDFLSPMQEPRETANGRMPKGRREQIHVNSEHLCDLPIVGVVDASLGSHYEDSLATVNLQGDHKMMDEYPLVRKNRSVWNLQGLMTYLEEFRENLKDDEDDDAVGSHASLDEDAQSSTSASRVSSEEHYDYPLFPSLKLALSEDVTPLPETSPRRREDELLEIISQETSTEDSLSVSSERSTEGDTSSHSQTTSCMNIRSMIRWFRKRVVSSRRRRRRTDTSCKDDSQLDPKKPSRLRGKRIQPQYPSRQETRYTEWFPQRSSSSSFYYHPV